MISLIYAHSSVADISQGGLEQTMVWGNVISFLLFKGVICAEVVETLRGGASPVLSEDGDCILTAIHSASKGVLLSLFQQVEGAQAAHKHGDLHCCFQ